MPYKDPQKQKLAQKRHYLRNKDLYIQRGVNRKAQIIAEGNVEVYKKSHPGVLFPNLGGRHRLRGTKPKVYPNLPKLGLIKKEQFINAGFETPKTLATKHGDLGGDIQRRIRAACNRGQLPAIKVGQDYYIYPEDGEAWCKKARILMKEVTTDGQ